MYKTERELVEVFTNNLSSDDQCKLSFFGTEFNYLRGKTDIVLVAPTKEIIAVEAKLSKWRIALQQAYRNLCFANKSYVLLPYEVAQVACQYESEFDIRGVGIFCLINDAIVVVKEAINNTPVQPWLTQAAYEYVLNG